MVGRCRITACPQTYTVARISPRLASDSSVGGCHPRDVCDNGLESITEHGQRQIITMMNQIDRVPFRRTIGSEGVPSRVTQVLEKLIGDHRVTRHRG